MTSGRHPDAIAAAGEDVDRRKAALWAALAALAQGVLLLAGREAYPYLRDLLLGPALLLLLPAIAHLHVRHAAVRGSGTILATLAGAAAILLAIAGELNADARPAALVALGMWWWTIGKLWAQTGVVAARLGLVTAAGGVLALAFSVITAGLAPVTALVPGVPDVALWELSRAALAAWSLALALALWSPARD